MKIVNKILTLLAISMVLVFSSGCNEFEEPGLVNNPDQTYTTNPVITSIEPADYAIAGVRQITIKGNNFAITNDTTWVYISGESVEVVSASETELVVPRPTLYGEGIDINVVVPSAISVAKVSDYKIENPIEEWGDFSYENYPLAAMEVADDEGIYVGTRRKILKIHNDGINIETVGEYSSAFSKISDMKMGPDGKLYVLVSKKDLYTIDLSTGEETQHHKFGKNQLYLDFDMNGNIYAGSKDGVFVLQPDGTETATDILEDITIRELRVINNKLYVLESKTLYSLDILDNNGSLGEPVVVMTIDGNEDFNLAEITSFNADANNQFLLCIKGHPSYSVFALGADGSLSPYYKNQILPHNVDQLIWGNSRYMYLSRGELERDSLRLYKMGMATNGAPYYGRQ